MFAALASLSLDVAVAGAVRLCRTASLLLCIFGLSSSALLASGPRWVAGTNGFDPAAKGLPIVWAAGTVQLWIDQGNLSSLVSQSQSAAMVLQAAAVWSAVPTAAVSFTSGGVLSEDVNGGNVTANSPAGTGAVLPADVQPTATNRPVAVIQDADGSVINAIWGPTASDPANCEQDGVFTQVDNLSPAGNIVHALVVLNGRCATTQARVTLMQYQLVRALGRVLGLDWSQVNDAMWGTQGTTTNGLAGWPIMHPYEQLCTGQNPVCMPDEMTLRPDDIAGLNRLYPVTSANLQAFPNKTLTAPATISVQGMIRFKRGQGMQGVNVTLTALTGGVPDARYQVSAVSGVRFHSDAGNPVTGTVDAEGNPLNHFGTDDAAMEGFFDLSGVPLPAGRTLSDYQLSFEPVNRLYVLGSSVGPYAASQVTPSGTMPTITLSQLAAGANVTQDVIISDSAVETHTDDGQESSPNLLEPNGEWLGRLTGYGHTGWLLLQARANRVFTVEATTLDEHGMATEGKAGTVLGFWNGSDALGSAPAIASTEPFNGATAGLTTLNAQTSAAGQVRIAFADRRGDGRPDFLYRGRVLYADTVFPARLTAAGGAIVIRGMGFRPGALVSVNGIAATVTGVTPTEITAVAPPVSGVTGAVYVMVTDPQTLGTASILDGLSYDAYGTDQIGLVTGPTGAIPQGVPTPFTVRVMAADNVTPAANVMVTFSLQQGLAGMSCGAATCKAMTNGAGLATMMLTAGTVSATKVQAALSSGASVLAEFSGAAAPTIAAVTPALYIPIGAQVSWQPQAIVLNNGLPLASAAVTWTAISAGLSTLTGAATNQAGIATTTVTAGPLTAGSTATFKACQTLSPLLCATFNVYAVHAELAGLTGISGVGQNLTVGTTPLPITLKVADAVGHPLAGATVSFYETLFAWQPSCPALGRCPAPQTLGTQTVTATSDAGGLVTLTPLTGAAGQSTTLMVEATTGQQGSMVFSIVEHP